MSHLSDLRYVHYNIVRCKNRSAQTCFYSADGPKTDLVDGHKTGG